jgi:hypothetical protein
MPKEQINPALLRQLLRYEPETGRLFWLVRPVEHFRDDACRRRWNTRFAGKEAFTAQCGNKYLQGHLLSTKQLAHRVAWAIYHGAWPTQIDHINGVRTDNRIANLREVTATENCRNLALQQRNKSGFIGVRWAKGAWQAEITIANRVRYLGRFQNLPDAATARRVAELEHGFHPNHGRRA